MKSALIKLGLAAFALAAGSAVQAGKPTPPPTFNALWSSSDQWGTYTIGDYTWNNDVWGRRAGAQVIWVNSVADWGVWSDQPNTGGVKSYPHITRTLNRAISQIGTLTAHTETTVPSDGAWETAYDIWDVNYQYEIMLWLNYTGTPDGCGNVKPISYNWTSAGCAIPVATVSLGGVNWNVFRGTNGANFTYSFLAQNKTNVATIDVKAILVWLKDNGWMGDVVMGEMQFGFEITSSYGGRNFGSKNYNVSFQ
jgi:xyloglucan-specific endo-beta-1,4-glucanase